jgi:hypothetical protein
MRGYRCIFNFYIFYLPRALCFFTVFQPDSSNVPSLSAGVTDTPLPVSSPTHPVIITPVASPVSQATVVPPATVAPEHAASERWRITFFMSGGFAGIQRSVELSDDGVLRVEDRNTGRQVTTQISTADLEAIKTLLTQVQPVSSSPRFSNCRDCLYYEITVQRGNETFTAEMSDLDLDQSALSLLINTLARVQEQALTPDAASLRFAAQVKRRSLGGI